MILIRVRDCCMYVIHLHCPVSSFSYPEDPFDRFWFFQGTNSTMLQSTAPLEYLTGANGSVLGANRLYGQPPGAALENAVSTSGTLTISLPGILSLQDQSSYTARLALHFAELSPTPDSRGLFVDAPVYPQTDPPTHLTITAAMWRMKNRFTLRPTSRHHYLISFPRIPPALALLPVPC
jgi:hypothetical protein